MFNPLPLLALGTVAIGYAGAIDQTDLAFDTKPNPAIAAFPAATNLSVQDYVGGIPETIEDPLCDVREAITSSLSDSFAETLERTWEHEQNVEMELWTSDLMGTWTLLRVGNDSMACIVSSGFGWEDGMAAESVVQLRPVS